MREIFSQQSDKLASVLTSVENGEFDCQCKYSDQEQAYVFIIKYPNRNRPQLFIKIHNYNIISGFYKNDFYVNNIDLFKRYVSEAIKKQNEYIDNFIQFQGQGYW